MPLRRNHSLKRYNTFGIDVRAAWLAKVRSVEQLQDVLSMPRAAKLPRLVLGGGSNVLFLGDYEGLVILNRIPGIEIVEEDDNQIRIRAGAGVEWHALVRHCVGRGWGGIENLSLIPGLCGAAPMQNIGAYGVELEDVFVELEALEIDGGGRACFDREACAFGYRESVFKREARGRYVIVSITLQLSKKPDLNTSYGAISDTLEQMDITDPGIKEVSEAVIRIRQSKLPDPAELGNAGSFFKNPELDAEVFEALARAHPDAPHYILENGQVKVPAGWLIEQCGWKGKQVGRTGSHKKQSLVLVNYGGATGREIWEFAQQIQASVQERFGVKLRPEVNRIG